MKQNILQIAVSAAPEVQTDALQAGKMYEHNATALTFTLEESLVLSEYRYYVEFVTVSGTARTAYLTPDENNQITVDLPVEVTAQMTALGVFNIVQIAENGKTEQVIKAKTVRLYFSALENTDRLIDENHAFSVNQLLEAIRQNTFKGEKGDKGDGYILTSADKEEIAETVNRSFFGLPMYKTICSTGTFSLPGAGDPAAVRSACVHPAVYGTALSDAFLTVGENVLTPILDSRKYSAYEISGSYGRAYFQLKPNTAYVLAKRRNTLNQHCSSYVQVGAVTQYFCHTYAPNLCLNYWEFTTDDTGIMILGSSDVMHSQGRYQTILETDWEGLFVGEKATSKICRRTFDTPLYAVNAAYADCFDILNGEIVRNTACVQITADMLDTASEVTLTDGTHTVYRHCILLPSDARKAPAVSDGFCETYAVTDYGLKTNSEYKAYVTATGNTECIFFGTAGNFLYIYSEKTPAEFSDILTAAETEGTPLTVLYALTAETRETETAEELPSDLNLCGAQICPTQAQMQMTYSANITDVFADLEARMKCLENRIEQGEI